MARIAEKSQLSPEYIKLVIAQLISFIGDSFSNLALTWFIVQTGTPMQVGIRLTLIFMPNILFSPFVGGIVDRVSRKRLLWVIDLVRMIFDLILIYFISINMFTINLIYIYTFAQAVVRIFYNPSLSAIVQQLSTEETRMKANALQDLAMRVGGTVGPILAGIAVKYLSKTAVIGFDAITFLISALIVFSLTIDEEQFVKKASTISYGQNMIQGFKYIWQYKWIIVLSLAFAMVNGGSSLSAIARPYLIKDILDLDVDAFGLMTSLAGVGAILTSMLLVKYKPKRGATTLIAMAIAVSGISHFVLAQANSFIMVVLIQFPMFAMGPLMSINSNTFYQNNIAPEYMGRVGAARSLITTLSMPVGYLLGDAVINYFGIQGAFIVSGLVYMVGALLAVFAGYLHKSLGTKQNLKCIK